MADVRVMDLTDFLLARIAEDEARAMTQRNQRAAFRSGGWMFKAEDVEAAGVLIYRPARVLAECEAKRQAIKDAWGDHLQIESEWGSCRGQAALEAANDYPGVVQWLASVYADHADYCDEWRP